MIIINHNHIHQDDLHPHHRNGHCDQNDYHHYNLSVVLTRPQWMALPVLEDPAMMSRCLIIIIIIIVAVIIIIVVVIIIIISIFLSSTCAASVVSSSMSPGLLVPTTLPCLEHLLNKALTL